MRSSRSGRFLVGQLFGTILDPTILLFFLPVMFFFSPIMTFVVLAFVGLIVGWLLLMLPTYRKKTGAVVRAQAQQGSFLIQNLHGIRTVKSLALDNRQKHDWDVLVARTAKARLAEGMFGTLVATVVRPLNTFAVSGSYRGRCLSGDVDQRSGVYRGPVRVHHAGAAGLRPADADGPTDQPV